MRTVYLKLKAKVILKSDDIVVLQRYIQGKYPGNNRAERARTLANAVNQIIERSTPDVDQVSREKIRAQIVQKAVSRNLYDIHAGDIFSACLSLANTKTWNENCLQALIAWVNLQQDIPVSRQVMDKLINRLSCLEKDIAEEEIYRALAQVEAEDGQDILENSASMVLPDALAQNEPVSPAKNLFRHRRRNRVDLFSEEMIGIFGQISTFRLANRKLKERLQEGEKAIPRLVMASCLLAGLVAVQPVASMQSLASSHNVDNRASLAEKADITPSKTPISKPSIDAASTPITGFASSPNFLPMELRYKTVNEQRIKYFLASRNSLLADEPYFSTIIKTSRVYDVNPLLLLAITGQEQGFVPRMEDKAAQIANNPYNINHSWQDYNTNIQDSTIIVAQTINNLSKNRPEDVHPLAWINRKYAQDQNWWIGVNRCWQEIEQETSPSI
ncbi:MAG: hypothetical protein ABFD18_03815 [Syntrophomonas sp.]